MYPIKFSPILKPTIWGGNNISSYKRISPVADKIGESWEISQVADNISVVSNGELAGKTLSELIEMYGSQLLGEKVKDRFGDKFPLLIKFIDACDDLSIQVHPNDKIAAKRHNSFGKTEMWYVVAAKENSVLYSGFSKTINPEKYIDSVRENTFMENLQQHKVSVGDVFFLPAGRVHAIGAGTFIAEIQQTSDITYRIYDYNRKDSKGNSRELHTELAKDAIDYSVYPEYKTDYNRNEDTGCVSLVNCPYFQTNMVQLNNNDIVRNNTDKDSFVIYFCIEGEAILIDSIGQSISLKQGETILIPACLSDVKIASTAKCVILETYIP